jgi:hypothetical protein
LKIDNPYSGTPRPAADVTNARNYGQKVKLARVSFDDAVALDVETTGGDYVTHDLVDFAALAAFVDDVRVTERADGRQKLLDAINDASKWVAAAQDNYDDAHDAYRRAQDALAEFDDEVLPY